MNRSEPLARLEDGGADTIGTASHPAIALGMEVSNLVFWFAGFISLGVFLSRLLFCRGTVCGAAQADTVFSAFMFATWGASITLLSRDVFKAGFRKPSPAVAAPNEGDHGLSIWPWYTDEPGSTQQHGFRSARYEVVGRSHHPHHHHHPDGHGLPPYRPSLEVARKKMSLAWDRRIAAPVSRPGSWSSDPWLGHKASGDEGWLGLDRARKGVSSFHCPSRGRSQAMMRSREREKARRGRR